MAKKRSSKKKTKTKKSSKSKSNFPVLIALGVILLGLAFYGLYETNQLAGDKSVKPSTSKPKSQNPVPAVGKISKPKAAGSKPRQNKFDRKDISAQDGQRESNQLNSNLSSTGGANDDYYTSSFDFGWPAYTQDDDVVEHKYYVLSYSEKQEQAIWVAYRLTRANLSNAKYKRKDNFRSDPGVKTKSASPTDYKGSGYDRGHLAPAADFTWSREGLDETFFMSNMSPQRPGFSRGIWKKLEGKVREWAKKEGKIFVVTGPIFKNKKESIGKNKVGIPSHYYKVLLDISGNDVKGIAFVLPNEKSDSQLSFFAMSIDDLEKVTGIDFFPLLPDDLENDLESQFSFGDW